MRAGGLSVAAVLGGLCLGGCPSAAPPAPVEARIGIAPLSGPAPLTVQVSASGSLGRVAPLVAYRWDFAGQRVMEGLGGTHTFSEPGRYRITLTVTDALGNQDTQAVDVRVRGSQDVQAVIGASRTAGPAPLVVQFDGTASSAPDDEILDYFWDFGDLHTSRSARPVHVYQIPGTYRVQLCVQTAGGVEGCAEQLITVDASGSALELSGAQLVRLAVQPPPAPDAMSVDLWFRPADGGSLLSFGEPPVAVQVLADPLRVRLTGPPPDGAEDDSPAVVEAPLGAGAERWYHLTVVLSGQDTRLYLDGAPAAAGPSLAVPGEAAGPEDQSTPAALPAVGALTVGGGFSGAGRGRALLARRAGGSAGGRPAGLAAGCPRRSVRRLADDRGRRSGPRERCRRRTGASGQRLRLRPAGPGLDHRRAALSSATTGWRNSARFIEQCPRQDASCRGSCVRGGARVPCGAGGRALMTERHPHPAPPTLVSLLICDQVIDDRLTGKKSAIGLFNTVVVAQLPTAVQQMAVMATLTEIGGRTPLELRLVRDADNRVLFSSVGAVEAPDPLAMVDLVFNLRGLRLAAAGQYAFELLSGGELLGRRRFHVVVRPARQAAGEAQGPQAPSGPED